MDGHKSSWEPIIDYAFGYSQRKTISKQVKNQSYPMSDAIEECLENDLGDWALKSESDLYKNDSLREWCRLERSNPDPEGPLGPNPSKGLRPGEDPSNLKEEEKIVGFLFI